MRAQLANHCTLTDDPSTPQGSKLASRPYAVPFLCRRVSRKKRRAPCSSTGRTSSARSGETARRRSDRSSRGTACTTTRCTTTWGTQTCARTWRAPCWEDPRSTRTLGVPRPADQPPKQARARSRSPFPKNVPFQPPQQGRISLARSLALSLAASSCVIRSSVGEQSAAGRRDLRPLRRARRLRQHPRADASAAGRALQVPRRCLPPLRPRRPRPAPGGQGGHQQRRAVPRRASGHFRCDSNNAWCDVLKGKERKKKRTVCLYLSVCLVQ